MKNTTPTPSTASSIRPFRIDAPQAELDELRARLAGARWPDQPRGTGWERGVPLDELRRLAERWRAHDWRRHEARLNEWPQFITEIDGQAIHFAERRSPEPDALPLLLLHGWPSSFVEFARVADALADPRAHGGDPADAFHVLIPSLPGFGFSGPYLEPAWAAQRTARAFVELMRRRGFARYGAHGGDVGAGVAGNLSALDPDRVVGVHVVTDPRTAVAFASFSGDPAANPALSEEERARVVAHKQRSKDGGAYLDIQTTRPQTLAYALSDSPVGQLAWIAEKFKEWTDPAAPSLDEAVDLDQLLTNVTVYWLTRSGASSAHVLYDNMHAREWGAPGPAPVGFAVFGADSFVRKLLDPGHRIAHWTEFDRGGHFPAMEAPERLTADVRAFFRGLR